MPENFFKLSLTERQETLAIAAAASGRPEHFLEKDAWVVWALYQLFQSPYAEHFVFKGGTSLSKAYHAIDRFSEDIDITYDIRAIAGDLVGDAPNALPANRSQQKRWTDEIRARLKTWVSGAMLPIIQERLAETDKGASAGAEGHSIIISYPALSGGTDYVLSQVKIEFGARSTGEPFEMRAIVADAASFLPDLDFPKCTARTMRAERTFWEKATAAHVYCLQGELGGERFARHWYDLVALDAAGIANRAIADPELAKRVADHKSIFFRENDAKGGVIDYYAAVSGKLRLVPVDEGSNALVADYAKMLKDGLLPKVAMTFDRILERCADIQDRANRQ
jgi:hypothetical protein